MYNNELVLKLLKCSSDEDENFAENIMYVDQTWVNHIRRS